MTELTQLPGEPPPQHSPAAGAVLLGPPTQAHLSAWGETACPPTLNTPATLRVPHTAGAGACASSRAISTSGGWGGRGCVSGIPSTHPPHTPHHTPATTPPSPRPPAPGLRAAATCLPPALPLLGQLAQPQCTRPGGGPLSPSLRGHASPGAPGTRRPAACLPASRRPGPHPTPHYPTPPLTAPQVSAMPPPVRTGSLPRTSAHCPRSCRSLSQSRLSGHPSTLRPSSLRHPLLMSSSGKAGQGETTLRGSERAPLRPRPRWSGGRGVAERWRP